MRLALIRSWRADSLAFCLARSRNYPMLKNLDLLKPKEIADPIPLLVVEI